MPLSGQSLIILSSIVALFFVGGILFLIFGYLAIPTDENGVCSCVNLSNELIGIFWGLATASLIFLISGIFFASLGIASSSLFKLMGLSILGAIIVFILSQRVGKCNIGCNTKLDTTPPLLISGWVLIVLSLMGFLYILTQVDPYKEVKKALSLNPVSLTKEDICDRIISYGSIAGTMSDQQILAFIKQYQPQGISDEQILALINQYRPLLT